MGINRYLMIMLIEAIGKNLTEAQDGQREVNSDVIKETGAGTAPPNK